MSIVHAIVTLTEIPQACGRTFLARPLMDTFDSERETFWGGLIRARLPQKRGLWNCKTACECRKEGGVCVCGGGGGAKVPRRLFIIIITLPFLFSRNLWFLWVDKGNLQILIIPHFSLIVGKIIGPTRSDTPSPIQSLRPHEKSPSISKVKGTNYLQASSIKKCVYMQLRN